MSRYYEESEIMKALDSNLVGTYYGLVLNVNMDEFLGGVPTADVVEVKHGKWIKNDNGTYSCSVCQSWIPNEQHYYANYCLHCGADMRRGEK